MRYTTVPHFDRAFVKMPKSVQTAFYKQVDFLVKNIRHPSLRAKKYDESGGIWQARVTNNVRFRFSIEGEFYILLEIEKHKD